MKKRAVIILVIIAALLFVCIYWALDPSQYPFPQCPFYRLTGLKCPGCGSQRALHQLLHFNILSAFKYNALLVVSIPLLAFLFSADLLREKCPKYFLASRHPIFSWGVLALIVLWWVLRNVFGW